MRNFLYRNVRWFVIFFEYVYGMLYGVDFRFNASYKGDGRKEYSRSSWFCRKAIGDYLRGKVTPNDSVIDVGCGKGRMLYFFSKFPFRKIAGLEYAQEFMEIAERNMQKLLTRGGGVIVIQGDATTYQDYDEYNYFYLYNPFTDVIMRPFLENVKASISRCPRQITFIYLNPVHHNVMIEAGFELKEEINTFGSHKCFVYSYGNAK